jgi:hypothetical protein
MRISIPKFTNTDTEPYYFNKSTQWRSLLSHCATSLKITGSIPDGVTGIFH